MKKHPVLGYTGVAYNAQGHVVGVKGVGKDTAATIVSNLYGDTHRIVHTSFALKLKRIVSEYYNLNTDVCDIPRHKELGLVQYPGWSWRKLLEIYGTDVVRNGLRKRLPKLRTDEIWLNEVRYDILTSRMTPQEKLVMDTFDLSSYEFFDHPRHEIIPRLGYSLHELSHAMHDTMEEHKLPSPVRATPFAIQVTDVRFLNEYTMLKQHGASIIQIRRMVPDQTISTHISNRMDPAMIPDIVIENNEDVEALERRIEDQIGMLFYQDVKSTQQ